MPVYYNEIDPFAAQWLRNLIAAGHIAPGDVDERSIALVQPDDLKSYTQCHFFAGIGVWSYALRKAGWPDDRPVWTGSCPCQPFSAAGKQEGAADARHLWPEWFRLIRECRPVAIFGEQVAAAIRHDWLDLVQSDLEGLDYALGAAVVGAHSVGAPHIRQRLYFVAEGLDDPASARQQPAGRGAKGEARDGTRLRGLERGRATGELADAEHPPSDGREQRRAEPGGRGAAVRCGEGVVGDTDNPGPQGRRLHGATEGGNGSGGRAVGTAGASDRRDYTSQIGREVAILHAGGSGQAAEKRQANVPGSRGASFWSDCDWLPCIDGKARPVEPGTFPLAHGAPARMGRLRAYGNAINAEVAQEFIAAYLG